MGAASRSRRFASYSQRGCLTPHLILGKSPTVPLAPDETLTSADGTAEYLVRHRVGGGAAGTVWAAIRRRDGETVSVKSLCNLNPRHRRRFLREVSLLRSLDHRNIVRLLDHGEFEGAPFTVMPLYDRALSADLLFPKQGDSDKLQVCRQVAAGVAYAHACDVVHRDLKPDNVLVNEAGAVVVTDFGMGKDLASADSHLTASGEFVGTEMYAAPEVVERQKNIDWRRADVYSLGRVCVEVLGGNLQLMAQSLEGIDPKLHLVLQQALEREPSARFSGAAEFLETLDRSLKQEHQASQLDSLQKTVLLASRADRPNAEVLAALASAISKTRQPDRVRDALLTIESTWAAQLFEKHWGEIGASVSAVHEELKCYDLSFGESDKLSRFFAAVHETTTSVEGREFVFASVLRLAVRTARRVPLEHAVEVLDRVVESREVTACCEVIRSLSVSERRIFRAEINTQSLPYELQVALRG